MKEKYRPEKFQTDIFYAVVSTAKFGLLADDSIDKVTW